MSGKRFTLGYEDDFFRWIRDNPNRKDYVVKIGFGEEDNLQDVCDLLNQLNNENEQLKYELGEKDIQLDFLKAENKHMSDLVNENKQLKKRNNNQYNQLNQLWQLIESKDWETLTAMNNQMKEDEERLQREWKCYE